MVRPRCDTKKELVGLGAEQVFADKKSQRRMKSRSNVFLLGFVFTLCMVIVNSSAHFNFRNRPRSTRGFKNAALSTARGFGKRDGFMHGADALMDLPPDSKKDFGTGFVKSFPEAEGETTVDQIVEEIMKDPRLAKVIKKLLLEMTDDNGNSLNILQNVEY